VDGRDANGSGRSNRATTRLGAAVEATDGRLGTVDQVVVRPQTGELSYVVVRRGWTNELFAVPAEMVREVAPSGTVYLSVTKEEARAQSANVPKEALADSPDSREVRIPLVEEELIPEKRWVDLGELRIHKFVDTREELIREAVTRDDLLVERVPVNQPLEAPLDTRVEDDWLVIPIMEEVLVVQKRLMLKEEVRIRKRQVTETQELHETVRSERAEIEDATVHGVKGLGRAQAALQTPQTPAGPEGAPATSGAWPEQPRPPAPEASDSARLPDPIIPPPVADPVRRTPVGAPDDETRPVQVGQQRRARASTPRQRRSSPAAGDDLTRPIAVDDSGAPDQPSQPAAPEDRARY
jgi:uncharacterized protein (TIGR02271 family)